MQTSLSRFPVFFLYFLGLIWNRLNQQLPFMVFILEWYRCLAVEASAAVVPQRTKNGLPVLIVPWHTPSSLSRVSSSVAFRPSMCINMRGVPVRSMRDVPEPVGWQGSRVNTVLDCRAWKQYLWLPTLLVTAHALLLLEPCLILVLHWPTTTEGACCPLLAKTLNCSFD